MPKTPNCSGNLRADLQRHRGQRRRRMRARSRTAATWPTSLGWVIAGQYVDNDLSAYSGKRRPEYQRLLSDMADGLVDAVVVYNIDRLTRRPSELEHFAEVVQTARIQHVRFVTGDTDIGTTDGLLMARILGAFAAKEFANIGRRVARKQLQNAMEGKPHKGSQRAFGYERDGITIREAEATVYRTLVARFLAGVHPISLTMWLTESGVETMTGASWASTTVKGMLTNPRYAGLRAHLEEVVAPGLWEPIITEDEHRRVLAKYAKKKMSNRRTPQRYVLSGLLRCGKCGNRLYSSARTDKGKNTRRYVCLSGPDHGGCGRLTITADPLERFVCDTVLYRLDTPDLADVLAGRSSADERTQDLTQALDEATSSWKNSASPTPTATSRCVNGWSPRSPSPAGSRQPNANSPRSPTPPHCQAWWATGSS